MSFLMSDQDSNMLYIFMQPNTLSYIIPNVYLEFGGLEPGVWSSEEETRLRTLVERQVSIRYAQFELDSMYVQF